jgi:hypothetical protein
MAELLSYDPPDADYGRIFTQARIIAWQFGFALLSHGSRTRDLDVLMVPWEDRANDKIAPTVVQRIAFVTGLTIKGEPSEKPHGRKAWTLFLPDGLRWVDLSVIPSATRRAGPMPAERIAMLWNSLPLETDAQSVVTFARAIEDYALGVEGASK